MDVSELRRLAEAAKEGDPRNREDAGRWEPWFTVHGDPHVSEKGRGQFGIVATVSTAPADYGKARAEFMAAVDPVTVLELLDRIGQLEAELIEATLARIEAQNPGIDIEKVRVERGW